MQLKKIRGKKGLKEIFDMTLKCKDKKFYTLLQDKPLIYFLEEKYAEDYMNERVKKAISLKSLRFKRQKITEEKEKEYKKLKKQVRNAPKNISISESVIIFDDKVASFNIDNMQGVIIIDKMHAESSKSFFEYLWTQAK